MNLTHNVSLLEAIWTPLSALGLVYATLLFTYALSDLRTLRREGVNSIREYAAKTTVILFGAKVIAQSIFVSTGLVLMTVPSNPHTTIGGIWLGIAFISTSVIFDVQAFFVERRRKYLLDKIRRQEIELNPR